MLYIISVCNFLVLHGAIVLADEITLIFIVFLIFFVKVNWVFQVLV